MQLATSEKQVPVRSNPRPSLGSDPLLGTFGALAGSGELRGFSSMSEAQHELLDGIVQSARASGPIASVSDRDLLIQVEADVLQRWRTAMSHRDAASVGPLVDISRALGKALQNRPQIPGSA